MSARFFTCMAVWVALSLAAPASGQTERTDRPATGRGDRAEKAESETRERAAREARERSAREARERAARKAGAHSAADMARERPAPLIAGATAQEERQRAAKEDRERAARERKTAEERRAAKDQPAAERRDTSQAAPASERELVSRLERLVALHAYTARLSEQERAQIRSEVDRYNLARHSFQDKQLQTRTANAADRLLTYLVTK